MTIEGAVATAIGLISLVFGGSLGTRYLKQAKDQAVQEFQIKELRSLVTKLEDNHNKTITEIALLNRDVQSLEEVVKKLDDIPKIFTELRGLGEQIASIQRSVSRLERSNSDLTAD